MTDQQVAMADHLPRRGRLRIEAIVGAGVAVAITAAVASAASPAPTSSATAGDPGTANGVERPLAGGPGFPGRFGHVGFGGITIAAIDGAELRLETEDGWTRTIEVTDETEISKGGEDASLSDLEVGDAVRLRQSRNDDGSFAIDAIAVVLPRIAGEVTAVDGSTLTIRQPDGSTGTVIISDTTELRVNGDAGAMVSDIEVGMVIVAAGERNDDGSIDAARAVAGDATRDGWRGPKLDRDGTTDDGSTDG